MKAISQFWEEVGVVADESAAHRGNEAELRKAVIGDSPVDFELDFPKDALRVGFLSKGKETGMYAATDFSYLENAGDFFHIYHVFRSHFEIQK